MQQVQSRGHLQRYIWLSIAAAVVTIALKLVAYWITNSIALLSDALESVVNLVAAGVALWMMSIAIRPPDEEHAYGHDKAEYFSSGVEGGLILVAATGIIYSSIERLLNPHAVEASYFGVGINVLATLINFVVARVLVAVGKRENSIALEADGYHLFADVWTSIGVIIGVFITWITKWDWLDSVIGLIVALNIVYHGVRLVQRSATGLLDAALPENEQEIIRDILNRFCRENSLLYHALRTRQSGSRRFMSVHVLVPNAWTIKDAHDMVERIEQEIHKRLPMITIVSHLEPIDDPSSWRDVKIEN